MTVASVPSPIPGVSVLVVREGRALVVRRGRAPLRNWWALPGGRLEAGESPVEAAAREIREETGLEVTNLIPIERFTFTADNGRQYALTVFSGEAGDGPAVAGDDAAELRWVLPEEGAALSLTDQTREVFARHLAPVHHAD